VGRLIPTRLAKVLDPEAQQPVPPGEAGELLVGSDYSYVMKGYLENPTETKETFVELDGRTWCRTGDHVKMSADGEIEFIDRRADLIKHKGYRVSAARVESVLQDHSAVVAACVVGVPDTKAGEQVKAFVILKADIRGVTSYDLTQHCRERLLPYEVPDYIEFRDMLPKSKIGKLLRREMRDEERRKVAKPS
jgi:long-chain acyl-CoA synthetase